MEGSFGSQLNESIKKQIEVRQNLQGRDESITVDLEKKYASLYQNAPWVCLRSSVDAPVIGTYRPGEKNEVTPNVAKEFILCGGTLRYFGQNSKDADKPNLAFSGEIINNRRTPGYMVDPVLGYRPKPGITKVSVKTKDTFGCIMEATVNFTVYSIEDLELIDQIYFKPGMSALLEWGHSVYLDNNGQLHNMLSRYLYPFPDFFSDKTFETIEQEVQEWRKTGGAKANPDSGTCGNYEVMFGYITNFNYSFNPNGSYSCTVKILSKGSLLEGFQIPSNAGCRLLQTMGDEQDSSIKSPFHRIFSKAEKAYESYTGNTFLNLEIAFDEWEEGGPSYYVFYGKNLIQKGNKEPVIYISLDTFLRMVNRVIQGAHIPDILFQVQSDEGFTPYPYATFDEHFSLNPGIAVLPCKADYHTINYEVFGLNLDNTWRTLEGALLMTRPEGLPQGRLQGENNLISDIWINIELIKDHVNQIIDGGDQGKYNLRVLVENVLDSVQKALGNVNSFGIQVNEITGRAEIVDRNCISSPENIKDDNPIIASGIKTTLKNLTVTSEISAEISSEMSIAATTPEDGVSVSNMDVVFWNEGCQDRHRPDTEIRDEYLSIQKQQVLLPGSTSTEQISSTYQGVVQHECWLTNREKDLKEKPFIQSKNFLEQVYYLYKVLNGKQVIDQGFSQYSDAAFSNLQLEGETLFRRCIDRDIQEAATSSSSSNKISSHFQAGIIPIKVEFTMKGIGRFIIGTTFKISEGLLPRKYKNWRHLITGVEHSIDKSGWYTTVTTLYYPVVVSNKNPAGGFKTYTNTIDTKRFNYRQASGNSEEYNYTGEYPAASRTTAAKNFFATFWKGRPSSSDSHCARYVASMAYSWKQGTQPSIMKGSAGGNAGDEINVGGVWKSEVADTIATKYGWTPAIQGKSLTTKELADTLQSLDTQPAGTVVIYYTNLFKSPKQEEGKWKRKHSNKSLMHVQMKALKDLSIPPSGRTVREGGDWWRTGWTSDKNGNYSGSWIYRSKLEDDLACRREADQYGWKLWVLTPPPINSNWKV